MSAEADTCHISVFIMLSHFIILSQHIHHLLSSHATWNILLYTYLCLAFIVFTLAEVTLTVLFLIISANLPVDWDCNMTGFNFSLSSDDILPVHRSKTIHDLLQGWLCIILYDFMTNLFASNLTRHFNWQLKNLGLERHILVKVLKVFDSLSKFLIYANDRTCSEMSRKGIWIWDPCVWI